MKAYVDMWIGTKDNPKRDHVMKDEEVHSWVRAFVDFLRAQSFNASPTVSTLDIFDTARVIPSGGKFELDGAIVAATGPRVGDGTTPFDESQTKLDNMETTMTLGAISIDAAVSVGGRRQWTVSRTLTNTGGTTINVNEIGLVGMVVISASGCQILMDRTVLAETKFVAPAEVMTLTYKIRGA
jgi:hypothetical protein